MFTNLAIQQLDAADRSHLRIPRLRWRTEAQGMGVSPTPPKKGGVTWYNNEVETFFCGSSMSCRFLTKKTFFWRSEVAANQGVLLKPRSIRGHENRQ